MSGNDVNNAYLSILKSYQQIDQQYSGFTNNALLNSSIFGSTGASSSSSVSKAAKWAAIASIAGSALTAGASIFGTIAMNKSMRQTAQQANTPTDKGITSVETFAKMTDTQLQTKRSELIGKKSEYMQKVSDAKQKKVDATAAKRQADADYTTANTNYQNAIKEKARQEGIVSDMGNALNTATSRKEALSAKKPSGTQLSEDVTDNMIRTEAEEQELAMLEAGKEKEGSVAYYEAKKAEAEAEVEKQARKIETERAERDKQAKLAVQKEDEASQAQNDEKKYQTLYDNTEKEIANIDAAIEQKANQPEQTDNNNRRNRRNRS